MFAAGRLTRVAGVGRVVEYSWTVVAGSWGRSRLVDRYDGMLWLTKDVSIRLLARTAGHTRVRCCSSRTVRNSESLRGLRCTMEGRRGRGKARALLGPLAVRTYRTGVKALSCPKPCGRERRLCRVKAVRTSGRERRLCWEAEAKMGVILALRYLSVWPSTSTDHYWPPEMLWPADRDLLWS